MKSPAIRLHEKLKGKISTEPKKRISSMRDLQLLYTPGVADACLEISRNPEKVYEYTIKRNTVAIITDGSSVLGLGNIGAEASLPVMEGKALIMKEFAGIDSFPIALRTQDPKEVVSIVKNISPAFGGINLEDIAAPACFEIEEALQDIGIPVMHDDQHGTAIVVLAALINASNAVKKDLSELRVVVNGAGAAGTAITRFLTCFNDSSLPACRSVKDILLCDSKGIIGKHRKDLAPYKAKLAAISNRGRASGSLEDALYGADVFIGVSKGNLVTEKMVRSMNRRAIVFAMANPVPEIMPRLALKAGAAIVATGRSDFPNQVNNALAFPGVFKGLLESRAQRVTNHMKISAAHALASVVKRPRPDYILPSIFNRKVVQVVSRAIKTSAERV